MLICCLTLGFCMRPHLYSVCFVANHCSILPWWLGPNCTSAPFVLGYNVSALSIFVCVHYFPSIIYLSALPIFIFVSSTDLNIASSTSVYYRCASLIVHAYTKLNKQRPKLRMVIGQILSVLLQWPVGRYDQLFVVSQTRPNWCGSLPIGTRRCRQYQETTPQVHYLP